MAETRKLAAILAADVDSRRAGADEDRTLARHWALRSDLIDPTISVHHGRLVKRTGDGAIIEFRGLAPFRVRGDLAKLAALARKTVKGNLQAAARV